MNLVRNMKYQICKYILAAAIFAVPSVSKAQQNFWISAYITSWCLNMTGIPGGAGAANYGTQPYDKIDLDAMTHLIAFCAGPDSLGRMSIKTEWDGSISWGGSLLERRRKPFNDYIHSMGKPILCTFFSRGSEWDGTPGIWTKIIQDPARRTECIKTILDSIILKEQYDGVDFDLEPLSELDTALTRTFFAELRDTLNKYHAWYDTAKKPLITAATYNLIPFWASAAPYLDQVNIMAYDMYGTWCTKVWHNSPVFSGTDGKDIYGNTLASIQGKTHSYINGGVPKEKLGTGVGMNGHLWQGGTLYGDTSQGLTQPLQRWETTPSEPKYGEWMYHVLFHDYIDTATTTLQYDDVRKCPYISIDRPGHSDDIYITFEDTSTMREVIVLADTMGIGGLILWDPTAAYIPTPQLSSSYGIEDRPGLVRDHLLQSVKLALASLPVRAAYGSLDLPEDYVLYQNYPNPFNPATKIEYKLPGTGIQYDVTLKVCDLLGRETVTLFSGKKSSGSHSVMWDASSAASGIYFYSLKAIRMTGRQIHKELNGNFFAVRKMIFIK